MRSPLRAALLSGVAVFTERDQPSPPRRRARRTRTSLRWTTAVLALLLSFGQVVDAAPESELLVGAGALATAGAIILLGRRALTAWRIAALTCAAWLFGPPAPPATLIDAEALFGMFLFPWVSAITLFVCFLLVARRYRRAVAWSAWGWTALLIVLGGYGDAPLAWLVVITAAAFVVDARRQRARAQADAERERAARAEQEGHSLVLEERARIARDLHDVVAHHMSMVAVQAETARYRLTGRDEATYEEFESIATSARAALSDVRGILTVLRDETGVVAHAPQPTLADLETLVATAASVGQQVTMTVDGRRRPLPTAVEIGAYRIVQESLANAARHAPGASVTIAVEYRPDALELTVTNGPPPGGTRDAGAGSGGSARGDGGHGLVGMRERATLLGGRLDAGPTADGGFRVAATVPLEVSEP